MDRRYTSKELTRIVDDSMEVCTNLLPYYCKENMDCWWVIKKCIKAVQKYNIVPELYWHGDNGEYTQLLILLSNGYPSPIELLKMAIRGTKGEIKNIACYFYQYLSAMFDLVKTYHGYVVLKPSAYMLTLYPESKDMLYVYTREKWTHNENSEIDGAVLIFRANEAGQLPAMLKKKLGVI